MLTTLLFVSQHLYNPYHISCLYHQLAAYKLWCERVCTSLTLSLSHLRKMSIGGRQMSIGGRLEDSAMVYFQHSNVHVEARHKG